MDYEFVPGRDDFPPDEIAMLRQQLASVAKERDEIAAQARMLDCMVDERDEQLAAALAACEKKDEAIDNTLHPCGCFQGCEFCNGKLSIEEALAIQPDASALRLHDEALIERCAEVCEQYDERIEAKRDSKYQAEYAGRQAGAMRCAAAIRELKASLDKMHNAPAKRAPKASA